MQCKIEMRSLCFQGSNNIINSFSLLLRCKSTRAGRVEFSCRDKKLHTWMPIPQSQVMYTVEQRFPRTPESHSYRVVRSLLPGDSGADYPTQRRSDRLGFMALAPHSVGAPLKGADNDCFSQFLTIQGRHPETRDKASLVRNGVHRITRTVSAIDNGQLSLFLSHDFGCNTAFQILRLTYDTAKTHHFRHRQGVSDNT